MCEVNNGDNARRSVSINRSAQSGRPSTVCIISVLTYTRQINCRSTESPLPADFEAWQFALLGQAVNRLISHLEQSRNFRDGENVILARHRCSHRGESLAKVSRRARPYHRVAALKLDIDGPIISYIIRLNTIIIGDSYGPREKDHQHH